MENLWDSVNTTNIFLTSRAHQVFHPHLWLSTSKINTRKPRNHGHHGRSLYLISQQMNGQLRHISRCLHSSPTSDAPISPPHALQPLIVITWCHPSVWAESVRLMALPNQKLGRLHWIQAVATPILMLEFRGEARGSIMFCTTRPVQIHSASIRGEVVFNFCLHCKSQTINLIKSLNLLSTSSNFAVYRYA